MTEFLGEGREDQNLDEGDELTKLEYAATSRQLTADEQQRLDQLHQNAGQILNTVHEKATESELTDSTTVDGDDSP